MSTPCKSSTEMDEDSLKRSMEQDFYVEEIYEGTYSVINQANDIEYIVNVDTVTNEPIDCTCPHFQYRCQQHDLGGRFVYCKHMYAVINYKNF